MTGQSAKYSLGCDIGGTFTDFILLDERSGQVTVEKMLTTPQDPSIGVINGIRSLALSVPGSRKGTRRLVHATTLAANAVIERKGAKTALLATSGFRDLLELRRHVRIKNSELWNDPPMPLVERYFRVPISERIWSDGRVIIPVDIQEVERTIDFLREEQVESVAISFLHSYVNSGNEEQVSELLKNSDPGLALSRSSEVLPEYREYERTATTVVNAYVKPVIERYLQALQEKISSEGFEINLSVTLSNGGLASVQTACELPVRMIESGAAAGVVAAKLYGQLSGQGDLLSFDMGGTTAKACLIKDGIVPITSEMEVARSERFQKGSGLPVAVPAIDLLEVGAGGGSVALSNELGLVQVGPESAGVDPGPICYGFGGKRPTVTDADLVLGYLDADYFLGGAMKLDVLGASKGLQDWIAEPLRRELQEAAWTVHDVVNESMASAVKMHVIEKGGDPTHSTLVAFGGAGPVHAYNVATKLGIPKILIPLQAGVMSAMGLLAAPPAVDLVHTHKVSLEQLDFGILETRFQEMEEEISQLLRQVEPVGTINFTHTLDICYAGQGYQISIDLPDDGSSVSREFIWNRFAAEYQEKYGYFYDDVPVELVNLRVKGSIHQPELQLRPLRKVSNHSLEVLRGERLAYSPTVQRMVPHQVYDRTKLSPGMVFNGPAIFEEKESTTVVDDGGRVEVDDYGTLVVTVSNAEQLDRREGILNLDVVWPRLISIADEMATTQIRTAFSHDVIEVHDMSTGICDARGYLIAQTALGATGHTGTMPPLAKTLLETIPADQMRPGDAYVTNDPWVQSGHTADAFVMTPIFAGLKLVGFALSSIHHLDIGGRSGSGHSEEVFEEGLIIPILPIMREGKPNEEFFSILRRNVRFSEKVIGDFRAQVATGYVGSQRVVELLQQQNLNSLEEVADEVVARSEAAMRRGLETLEEGTYQSELNLDLLDDKGEPLKLCLTLTVRGSEVHVDFTGTSAQVRRPINDPINHVRAFVVEALKMISAPGVPNNEGAHRPIHVTAPEGSLLNPVFPAPVFWRIATGTQVSDLVFEALSRAAPGRVPAGSGSLPVFQFYISGLRCTGEPFALHQHVYGGMGGRPSADGLASVSFPYSVREVSTEGLELETPLLCEMREVLRDSGGPGQQRGGLGEVFVIRVVHSGDADPSRPLVFSGSGGRFREPPHGILGGKPGANSRILIDGVPVDPAALGNSPEIRFRSDQTLTIELAGGGGYGNPKSRNPESIQADLKNGYISSETASREYGYDGGFR